MTVEQMIENETAGTSGPATTDSVASVKGEIPDFGALLDSYEADDSVPASTTAIPAGTTVEQTPVTPPAPAATPPVVEAPVTPSVAPVATATQQPQPPAAEPPAPTVATTQETPPAQGESFDPAKFREQILPKLEANYQLTPEEAEAVRLDPAAALPKMAARLHFEVLQQMNSALAQFLPGYVAQQFTAQASHKEAESAFYTRWDKLKAPEHRQTVIDSIRAVRAANPKISQADLINRAGALAMISLGFELTPQGTVAAPVAPVVTTPTPPRPAGVGNLGTAVRTTGGPASDLDALFDAHVAGEVD